MRPGTKLFGRLFRTLSFALVCLSLTISLLGLAVSIWAHVLTLIGFDPGSRVQGLWVCDLVLLALLLPVILDLFLGRSHLKVFRSPRWMQLGLYFLLGYYGLNFYVFLYWSANHLDSRSTWRMFSSGWLLLFALAAVFYHVGLLDSKRRLPS